MKKIKAIILIFLIIFSFSSVSLAQINFEGNKQIEDINNDNNDEIINLILWALGFLAMVDTIYIFYNSF
jgi:predicted RND superfamily exporter protein